MKTIALGPASPAPTWTWIGLDMAAVLSQWFAVRTFRDFRDVPSANIVFLIKHRPPDRFVTAAIAQQQRLVYAPVDRYISAGQLVEDSTFLGCCDAVVCHCERLLPLLAPVCRRLCFIDHHNKYALPALTTYKSTGYVLWIGGCQYLPYLLRWRRAHPLSAEVKILTDLANVRARLAGQVLANRLGLGMILKADTRTLDDCEVYAWSEPLQRDMMIECKAALDIKDEVDFNQVHKPATKVQQFVASGIPCAVNVASYAHEYFQRRGFDMAAPVEWERWFSPQYWQETQMMASRIRQTTSLEAVAQQYRELFDGLVQAS